MNLAYTDTDSCVIKIETDDLYNDFKRISNHMDFSDYDAQHDNLDYQINTY